MQDPLPSLNQQHQSTAEKLYSIIYTILLYPIIYTI